MVEISLYERFSISTPLPTGGTDQILNFIDSNRDVVVTNFGFNLHLPNG